MAIRGGTRTSKASEGKLDNPTGRAKWEERAVPYWKVITKGRYLGYRKGKKGGSWLAKLYLPNASPSRRQVVLGSADDESKADGLSVLDHSQALAKATAWFTQEEQRAKGIEVTTGPYSVAEAVNDYIKNYTHRGGKALKSMVLVLKAHILPELGPIQVSELSRARVQKWFEKVTAAPARIRSSRIGLQRVKALKEEDPSKNAECMRKRRSSANRILTVLKAVLNLAVDSERVTCSGNAWRLVKPHHKVDGVRVRFLSVEEQQAVVMACEPSFAQLVRAALFTGARYGELARLDVRDFHPVNGQIYFSDKGKSKVARWVVLTPEGVAFFNRLTEGREKSERLLLGKNGKPWGTGHQVRPLKLAVEAAAIESGLTFHELRHTYASTMIMAGVNLKVVAQQLGHEGTRMVEKHYGHLTDGYVVRSIRELAPHLGLVGDPVGAS